MFKKKKAAPQPEPDLLQEPPVPADDMAVIIKAVFASGRQKGYEEGYAAGKAASTTITACSCAARPLTITYGRSAVTGRPGCTLHFVASTFDPDQMPPSHL